MDFHLIVVSPFGDHARGDVISDADSIEAALRDHEAKVVRIHEHLSPAKQEG